MKAFIFDMDGVIIDSEPLNTKIVIDMLAENSISITDQEFKAFAGMAPTSIFSFFIKQYNLPFCANQMSEKYISKLKSCIIAQDIQPIEGIVPLIKNLHSMNIPMTIASSSSLDMIKFITNNFGIGKYFKCLISGEDLPRSKPAPDIYLKTAQNLGAAPSDCVVLEDSKNGTIAAKTAGMYCIGFANPNSGSQDLSRADIIVNKITDIDITRL